MKATVYFIVEVDDTYNNTIELSDGSEMMVNNSIDSVEHINRVGRVIDTPKGAKVDPGDLLLFHHNICRETWGLKSTHKVSNFAITNHIFYIPITEVFMVMRGGEGGEWEAFAPFCFVEPIPVEVTKLDNGLEIEEESYKGKKPLVGIMAYPNEHLLSMGVEKGDKIAFQQDSEHEYNIKGKLYYKMRTNDILAVL